MEEETCMPCSGSFSACTDLHIRRRSKHAGDAFLAADAGDSNANAAAIVSRTRLF